MLFSGKKCNENNKSIKAGREAVNKVDNSDKSSGDEKKKRKKKINGIVSLFSIHIWKKRLCL